MSIFQVRADGLRDGVPAAADGGCRTGEPAGADDELRRVVTSRSTNWSVWCVTHRLVTLTGVGGVGKTRLAVEVAAELVPEFGDGVWLVELAAVGDPAAVPDAVAAALGITQQPGRTGDRECRRRVGRPRAAAGVRQLRARPRRGRDLVEAILARSATVTMLATSREGLRVGDEQLWPVPSLDVGRVARAVELFVERARAVHRASRRPTATTRARWWRSAAARRDPVGDRAGRLADGVDDRREVRDRLERSVPAAVGSRRGLERHQTLRHAVQWSYDLLTPDEQLVLAVFGVRRRIRPRQPPPRAAAAISTTTRCWICSTRWCASRW